MAQKSTAFAIKQGLASKLSSIPVQFATNANTSTQITSAGGGSSQQIHAQSSNSGHQQLIILSPMKQPNSGSKQGQHTFAVPGMKMMLASG